MRPVCPLRKGEVVDKAIRTFIDNPDADSLRAVCYSREIPYKMWRKKGKYMEPLIKYKRFREPFNMPRQALPKALYQHAYVDIVRPEVILKHKLMSGKKILPFFCENLSDIDYPEDLIVAERLLGSLE
jgi:CMP-N-acetylneuraminic acid synthetase